jgi:hypothetical protein
MALWFEWYERFDALRGANLNNVWVYLLVFVLVFFAWIAHFEFLQRRCYRRHRPVILDELRRVGMSRLQLLASIVNDKMVATVAEALKRDRSADVDQIYSAAMHHRQY